MNKFFFYASQRIKPVPIKIPGGSSKFNLSCSQMGYTYNYSLV